MAQDSLPLVVQRLPRHPGVWTLEESLDLALACGHGSHWSPSLVSSRQQHQAPPPPPRKSLSAPLTCYHFLFPVSFVIWFDGLAHWARSLWLYSRATRAPGAVDTGGDLALCCGSRWLPSRLLSSRLDVTRPWKSLSALLTCFFS